MPVYEYTCQSCRRRARIRLSYAEYDQAAPRCPHCGSAELKRRVGRVAVARSEDSRLDGLMSDESLGGLEEDPRAMGRLMRQMSREMGEELGDEMEELAGRLVKGESPIHRSVNARLGKDAGFGDEF